MDVKKVKGFNKFNTMYALKHTFIVECVKSGEPINNIMKVTGHDQLSSFQNYIQKYLDQPAVEVKSELQSMF